MLRQRLCSSASVLDFIGACSGRSGCVCILQSVPPVCNGPRDTNDVRGYSPNSEDPYGASADRRIPVCECGTARRDRHSGTTHNPACSTHAARPSVAPRTLRVSHGHTGRRAGYTERSRPVATILTGCVGAGGTCRDWTGGGPGRQERNGKREPTRGHGTVTAHASSMREQSYRRGSPGVHSAWAWQHSLTCAVRHSLPGCNCGPRLGGGQGKVHPT